MSGIVEMTGEAITEARCPACGATLSQERRTKGLCPGCVLELALESPSLMAEIEEAEAQETLAYSREAFTTGQILGNRYRIRSLLGRGGMGEVWRATDLKLRVDVALKALHQQLLGDSRALKTLRQEVRSAREVVSPNVCRVFDLVELDGQELVSMEYIDGITLLNILKMRAPLDLSEAREIAAQFLAGLEAIHAAGLVHRDVKPENLMMTRSGRVVLMDFGIARGGIAKGLQEAGASTIAGTPAYMSPEQSRGDELDARADVFSAGVVLAEMIAPGGLKTYAARQQIWKGAHHQPPTVAETPWVAVLKRSVAQQKEQRFPSASALARALEEVTLRAAGDEDLHPYPGLSSFTEDDSEYFFGRELEIEEMWKKLHRPHLLALIGPSGAGKSSFLRAGLLSVIPTGWRAVVVSPGSQPFSTLARALVPELTGDTEALQLLTSPDDSDALLEATKRWRSSQDEVLLILDQFEELFTLNPPEIQQRFAELLSRLALEADIHVLLAMRDDFLFHCTSQDSLGPIFSELSPLKPLSGAALRRALVQPALKCGYRFEDDSLVDEMVEQVGEERGALPLLAFAAARLWSLRDREQGLLTREAYDHIGGVGGALAQHAEQTLEKIGQDNLPTVREIFRNLVTSQGTRVARTRNELLSVFSGHDPESGGHVPVTCPPAANVLDTLIDARLLTSYEEPADDEDGAPQQRIEIIHESLLSNWPRLVRWRTQDEDSSQLRDQLRQAAQMWAERGRPADLLWTGTSYKEYELWCERYEGGLSTSEERFAGAMKTKAGRRKRQMRLASASAFAILLAVLTIVGVSRQQAVQSARRAEAAALLALGRAEIATDSTRALAFSLASLEVADTSQARWFALEALWSGPPKRVLLPPESGDFYWLDMSSDGRWIVLSGHGPNSYLWSREGGPPKQLGGHESFGHIAAFGPSGKVLATLSAKRLRRWIAPDWHEGESIPLSSPNARFEIADQQIRTITWAARDSVEVEAWGVDGSRLEGLKPWQGAWVTGPMLHDPEGTWVGYPLGKELHVRPLDGLEVGSERLVGRHRSPIALSATDAAGSRIATSDEEGEIRIWEVADRSTEPLRILNGGPRKASIADPMAREGIAFDLPGTGLAARAPTEVGPVVRIWDLAAPTEEVPTELGDTDSGEVHGLRFDPRGDWLAVNNHDSVLLWPLLDVYPRILRASESTINGLAFDPDGKWVATGSEEGIHLWPLPEATGEGSLLFSAPAEKFCCSLAPSPDGENLVAGIVGHGVVVVPIDGGLPRRLPAPDRRLGGARTVAISADGQLVASGAGGSVEGVVIPIWDLGSGKLVQTLDPGADPQGKHGLYSEGIFSGGISFAPAGQLLTAGHTGVRVWDLEDGTSTLLIENLDGEVTWGIDVSPDGGSFLVLQGTIFPGRKTAVDNDILRCDLESLECEPVHSHGTAAVVAAFDPTSSALLSGDFDGVLRVGSVTDAEPHVLFATSPVSLAISPDGRWVAVGGDKVLQLWPFPDTSRPPLHTLPHDQLLAKLRSFTNLRVLPDDESTTGYSIRIEESPGWDGVPTW